MTAEVPTGPASELEPGSRIALVSMHASPLAALGGVDAEGQVVHIASLASGLAARGHAVTVYTRRDRASVAERVRLDDGVVVEHLNAGPAAELPVDALLPCMREFGDQLARRWRAERPDVVHAHFWMSGFAALVAARDLALPVVATFHALGSERRRHLGTHDTSPPQRVRIERAIAHDAAAIIATSSDEVLELGRMGVRRDRIQVVPCGVDVGHFSPYGPAAPRGDQRYRLLTLGRLAERKGVDDAIRALCLVANAELVIAGGPDRALLDGDPDVARLRRVAAGCHVQDRVHFLGRVGRDAMPALLRSADVLVAVPWYEPFGLVALEAMGCGVPVVASEVGGLRDTVAEGSTGDFVAPRRPEALAHCLRTLLSDPVRREGYGLAGADRARARYGWDRVALDTEAGYARVLASRSAQVRVAG